MTVVAVAPLGFSGENEVSNRLVVFTHFNIFLVLHTLLTSFSLHHCYMV